MTTVLRALTAALVLVGLAACGSTPGNTGASTAPVTSAPAASTDASQTNAGSASYPAPEPSDYPAPSASQ